MSAMRPVLAQIYAQIKKQAIHSPDAPYLVFEVPKFVFGYPLFKLTEARELLRRAVAVDPSFANGQVALGVAALRDQDLAEARQALERAIELEPGNPYALRTLGSLLTTAGALAAGQNGSGRPWRWHRTMLWPACAWPKRCWSWIQMSTATRPISCCCG
jgi:tetratricopeptide (TPR) repeat protein